MKPTATPRQLHTQLVVLQRVFDVNAVGRTRPDVASALAKRYFGESELHAQLMRVYRRLYDDVRAALASNDYSQVDLGAIFMRVTPKNARMAMTKKSG